MKQIPPNTRRRPAASLTTRKTAIPKNPMEAHDEDEKTRLIRRKKPEAVQGDPDPELTQVTRVLPPDPESDEGMTQLVGPARRSGRTESASGEHDDGGELDPVVGWLVVLSGPGRGNARRLGYGQNSIGRDKSERVPLDFGDSSISRTRHCFIIYEPRKRQYFLRPGDGANLTYINGELLAETRPLDASHAIEI